MAAVRQATEQNQKHNRTTCQNTVSPETAVSHAPEAARQVEPQPDVGDSHEGDLLALGWVHDPQRHHLHFFYFFRMFLSGYFCNISLLTFVLHYCAIMDINPRIGTK